MSISSFSKVHGTTKRVVVFLIGCLSLFLFGCSTLPKKLSASDTYLVLIVENGGGAAGGSYSTAAPFLLSTISSEPLRLKSGMNFVGLPVGSEEIRLKNLYISPPDNIDMPYSKGYLGYVVKRPEQGSVVLVAKKLRYFVRTKGNIGQMVFETSDLSEEEIERILKNWKEEQRKKTPVEWDSFQVTRPETMLF